MNVCIVGWYYTEKFYQDMALACPHWMDSVFVVKHKMEPDALWLFPSFLHPNIGLEFGAFQQYLDHHWDRESAVLFIQDDTTIDDIKAIEQIASLEQHGVQMAYIFSSEYEEIVMGGAHGRAVYCSAEFLDALQKLGGFPYDELNGGTNSGPGVNIGIQAFMKRAKQIGNIGIGACAIVPGIRHGRRGVLHDKPYFYDRQTRETIVELSEVPNGVT